MAAFDFWYVHLKKRKEQEQEQIEGTVNYIYSLKPEAATRGVLPEVFFEA